MTLKEWAALIRVSPTTAWRKVAAGEVAVVNVGTSKRPRLRVTDRAHEAYLNKNQVRGSAA